MQPSNYLHSLSTDIQSSCKWPNAEEDVGYDYGTGFFWGIIVQVLFHAVILVKGNKPRKNAQFELGGGRTLNSVRVTWAGSVGLLVVSEGKS